MLKSVCLSFLLLGSLHANDAIERAIAHAGRSEADLKRDERDKPLEILSLTGVQPGWQVADIFSASGYYCELFSYLVGDQGKVYAHNNRAYLSFLGPSAKTRYQDARLPNVTVLDSETDDLSLPQGELDLVAMVMVYHDLYHVSAGWPKIEATPFLAQIFRSVKSGGKVLVVDHSAMAGSGSEAAQTLHRIEESFAIADFEKVGFKLSKKADFLRNAQDPMDISVFDPSIRGKTDRFVLVFRKP